MIEKLSVEIEAPLEEVWRLGCEYDVHYRKMSSEHLERVLVMDFEKLELGFYFRQRSPVTKRIQKIRGKVTRLELNRADEWRSVEIRFLFPYSLILYGYTSIFEGRGKKSQLTVLLRVRFGRILKMLSKKKYNEVINHLKEELINLKELAESSCSEKEIGFKS